MSTQAPVVQAVDHETDGYAAVVHITDGNLSTVTIDGDRHGGLTIKVWTAEWADMTLAEIVKNDPTTFLRVLADSCEYDQVHGNISSSLTRPEVAA